MAKKQPSKPPAKPRGLLPRQERFCEFIASGMSNVDAWLAAGYKVSRDVARANSAESLANPSVAAKIAELRKPQTEKAFLTRDRKRELLREISEDSTKPLDARLRAIAEDNKMAGHYEPEKIEVESGPKALESIRERAAAAASALDLNARLRMSGNRPAAARVGLSRWAPESPA